MTINIITDMGSSRMPKSNRKVSVKGSHVKFGEGTVADMINGGRDYEVTVDFDTAGRKKMFAGFAKLVKI